MTGPISPEAWPGLMALDLAILFETERTTFYNTKNTLVERGIVSSIFALLPRSSEVKPLFSRFVQTTKSKK